MYPNPSLYAVVIQTGIHVSYCFQIFFFFFHEVLFLFLSCVQKCKHALVLGMGSLYCDKGVQHYIISRIVGLAVLCIQARVLLDEQYGTFPTVTHIYITKLGREFELFFRFS